MNDIEKDHYRRLIEAVEEDAKRHPWYGPCDGLWEGGTCSECSAMERNLTQMVRRLLHALGQHGVEDELVASVTGYMNTHHPVSPLRQASTGAQPETQ